jgi:hypothetical protein
MTAERRHRVDGRGGAPPSHGAAAARRQVLGGGALDVLREEAHAGLRNARINGSPGETARRDRNEAPVSPV